MRGLLYNLPCVSIGDTLSLRPGIVDVWYFFYARFSTADLTAAHGALLSPSECQRCARFQFERHRRQFIAARALVRCVLSRYARVNPTDWRFNADALGKPCVDFPVVTPTLHFNLAHTQDLVVCAVSAAHNRVGVDAERIDGIAERIEIAAQFFSDSEVATLRALTSREQPQLFFEYWTLKESYLKALGLGLAVELNCFSFVFDGDAVHITDERQSPDYSRHWQFASLHASPIHQVAVAVDTGGGEASFRSIHLVPLREARTI
jgi:4'-phosphopantetheinyl transferase